MEVAEGLGDLHAGIHDERPADGDRVADRLAGEQDEVRDLVSGWGVQLQRAGLLCPPSGSAHRVGPGDLSGAERPSGGPHPAGQDVEESPVVGGQPLGEGSARLDGDPQPGDRPVVLSRPVTVPLVTGPPVAPAVPEMTDTCEPGAARTPCVLARRSWYRVSVIFWLRGRVTHSWRGCACSLRKGSSRWMMPRPAGIHCTSPGPSTPALPRLSPCSSAPSSTIVTVSRPRCGCHSKPGEENQSSDSSRKGSASAKFPGGMTSALLSTWASGPSGVTPWVRLIRRGISALRLFTGSSGGQMTGGQAYHRGSRRTTARYSTPGMSIVSRSPPGPHPRALLACRKKHAGREDAPGTLIGECRR